MYEDIELWYPYYRLKEEGADVKLIGPGSEEKVDYKGKNGYPATSDTNAKNVKAEQIDAIIVPGGFAPDFLRRYDDIIDLVKNVYKNNKLIAAICHGPSVLVSADILKGKKVTSFMAIKQDVINAGATYVDEEVVRDGTIITSRKPADLPAFCKKIIEALK